MTGGEFVAGAAAAASKAVVKAAEEQTAIDKDLRNIAAETPGMQAAASVYGRRQAVKQEILLRLYKPLAAMVGVSKAYFDSDFGEDLAAKMADVPDEEVRTPKASIAGPAMQGLGFSLDELSLKDMYLELLAHASDSRTSDDAHPSFADVIRQLDSVEAEYLSTFLDGQHFPVMRIGLVHQPSGGKTTAMTHVTDPQFTGGNPTGDARFSAYVDNWIRLGLIVCTYQGHLTRDGAYDWIDEHPLYLKGVDEAQLMVEHNIMHDGDTTVECVPEKGIMKPTSFGSQFARTVGLVTA